MLKITVEPDTDETRVKLEGDLTGTGVHVLEEFWLASRASYEGVAVSLDLSGVSRVDDAGKYLLALIYRTGARLLSAGVEMKALVDSIDADWPPSRTSISSEWRNS
jgi:anti-anti-sigma regulatory factor